MAAPPPPAIPLTRDVHQAQPLARRPSRRYLLLWLVPAVPIRDGPPGWIRQVVYAHDRTTGATQRLDVLRRVAPITTLPPDDPPPTLPAAPTLHVAGPLPTTYGSRCTAA